ncbi:30S ribosomal protein S2 [Patescibacteria group bacterium]|nr:30S ribosomal protein S2 [Patescibacteria group bacterium]
MKKEITLKTLLEAGAHFGHQSQRWDPRIADFLYGAKDGVHVFDLAKTKKGLEETAQALKEIAASGGKIVFVGTKRQAQEIIKEEAQRAGMPYVKQRWLGGTITNWEQIKKRIDRLIRMKEEKERGEYKRYTKKEQVLIDRDITRLERFFEGLIDLKEIPQALFVVDIKREVAAVKEAQMKKIPVAAIVDSNCDPTLITHIIPANDDAIGSLKVIVSFVADYVREGREAWEKKQEIIKTKEEKHENKND